MSSRLFIMLFAVILVVVGAAVFPDDGHVSLQAIPELPAVPAEKPYELNLLFRNSTRRVVRIVGLPDL